MKIREILDVVSEHLAVKTRSTNYEMFKVLTTHHFSVIASMMRAKVAYLGEELPLNQYSLVLAESGAGKNMSINALADLIADPFTTPFKIYIQQPAYTRHVAKLAVRVGAETGIDPEDLREEFNAEFIASGGIPISFGSDTLPAVRQYHRLAVVCNAGSLNLVCDEIGLALADIKEALPAFLTLYDKGLLEQKLLKGGFASKSQTPITGSVPANLLMFGTQSA